MTEIVRLVGRATPDTEHERVLHACVMPWGVAATVSDNGRTAYRETWQRGSLVAADRVAVYDTHEPGAPMLGPRAFVGRADDIADNDDGLYARLVLFDTPRGRELWETAKGWGAVDVSIETVVPNVDAADVVRTAADPCPLTGVAVILPPHTGAFAGAAAIARAAIPTDPEPEPDDPDPDEPEQDDDDMTTTETPTPDVDAGRAAHLSSEIAEQVRAQIAQFGRLPARGEAVSFAFPSRVDMFHTVGRMSTDDRRALNTAFRDAYVAHTERRLAARVWADQLSSENPGVMPPGWLTTVFGNIDRARPVITALGARTGPTTGLDVNWPYYDGDLDAIVAVQTAEKTEINSVKVSLKRGTATMATYAGGSDIALQLLNQSSPSYLAVYQNILEAAYARCTEAAFETALAGVDAAPGGPVDIADDNTGSIVKGALFAASSEVEDATGSPASVAIAAPDVYAALGGKGWLQPPMYGMSNTPGTAAASTLSINISGLPVVKGPFLPAGTLIVTNDMAAGWIENGPYIISDLDVQRLGQDVAIWGLGAPAVFIPAGIVELATDLVPGP